MWDRLSCKCYCVDRKLAPEDHHWLEFNKEMSKQWPVITKVKDPMPTYEEAAKYTAHEQWSKVSDSLKK